MKFANYPMYKNVLVLLLGLLTLSSLEAGVDFAAIGIPGYLRREFISMQEYVAHRLKKNFSLEATPAENLHITLKEIADLNDQERKLVKGCLKKVSKGTNSHDIKSAISQGKLKIHPDGLVILKLKPSQWLTTLSAKIDKALRKLKNQGSLRHLKKRNDFPNRGHITLGYLKYNHKPVDKHKTPHDMITYIQQGFRNHYNKPFTVDRFVLLKSNSPVTPRLYGNKGTFYLK